MECKTPFKMEDGAGFFGCGEPIPRPDWGLNPKAAEKAATLPGFTAYINALAEYVSARTIADEKGRELYDRAGNYAGRSKAAEAEAAARAVLMEAAEVLRQEWDATFVVAAKAVRRLLTFDEIPSKSEIAARAAALAEIAVGHNAAMIGGAQYLMGALENALIAAGVEPLYSFSKRESVETVSADGSVFKTNVFRHVGWVRA